MRRHHFLVRPMMCPKYDQCARGFTLTELMITLALVGIVASVAYPSYQSYLTKGRRSDAHVLMMEAAVKQEHFYAQHGVYTADMRNLGYSANPASTTRGVYQIGAVLSGGGSGFTLTAVRQGVQTSDTRCGDLTLTHTRIKSAVNQTESEPARSCW